MIALAGATARVGTFALRDATLHIPGGEWGIVLGAAGSGKTTLLEVIAGVRAVSAGRVLLRGSDVTDMPPEARALGLVYQHSMLFPHLSVAQNVAYGARQDDAGELARRFAITSLFGRDVNTLSGGERQLVALVRALATAPDVLLLDEPFSALDPRRRAQARTALREIQQERRITVLQVTHDFSEAGMLGDIVAVMQEGRIVQSGPPTEVFRAPASAAVADFLGAENVFSGTVTPVDGTDPRQVRTHQFHGEAFDVIGTGIHPGGQGHAVIRGEDVTLLRLSGAESSARNSLPVQITEIALDGVLARVSVRAGGETLVSTVTRSAVEELGLVPGARVVASIKATSVHIC